MAIKTAFKHGIRKDWMTESGLRAVVYMTSLGHNCGYVGVPAGHPLHGLSYSASSPLLAAPGEGEPVGKRGAETAANLAAVGAT